MSHPIETTSMHREAGSRGTDPLRYRVLSTPTGSFAVTRDGRGQLGTTWLAGARDPILSDGVPDERMEERLVERLLAYFDGTDVSFDDVPTPPGPAFFRRCWHTCRTIPRGETRSYGELARFAGGSSRAARAAGQAMRRNPLPLIVPCHRVIGSTGRLVGFAGSQDLSGTPIDRKRWLLAHEQGAGSPAAAGPAAPAHAI